MLILTSNINREGSGCAIAREAVVGIEPLFIRAAEVIDDRLTKMIAVVQWLPADRYDSRVHRFNFGCNVRFAVEECQFVCEFLFELKFKCGDFFRSAFFRLQVGLSVRSEEHTSELQSPM